MSTPHELDEYIYETRKLAEDIRMEIAAANEVVTRLRKERKEIKQLLDKEIPRIVAEAVALHISRSTNVKPRHL